MWGKILSTAAPLIRNASIEEAFEILTRAIYAGFRAACSPTSSRSLRPAEPSNGCGVQAGEDIEDEVLAREIGGYCIAEIGFREFKIGGHGADLRQFADGLYPIS